MNKKEILNKLNKISKPIDLIKWGESVGKWNKIINDYERKRGTVRNKANRNNKETS